MLVERRVSLLLWSLSRNKIVQQGTMILFTDTQEIGQDGIATSMTEASISFSTIVGSMPTAESAQIESVTEIRRRPVGKGAELMISKMPRPISIRSGSP